MALLAIGWFAGTFAVEPVDDTALPEQPLPAVATQQPAPPAAPPAPQAAPVTVYVPVTVKQQAPATKKKPAKEQVVALPPAETKPPEQPRSDLGSRDKAAESLRSMMDPVVASSLAMEMAQGMMSYGR